jgi:hypothetical protein
MMGNMIVRFPGARVFNLNDGAMIKGAAPLDKKDFVLEQRPAGKSAAVNAVKGAFDKKQFNLKALEQSLLDQIDDFIEKVSAIIGQEQKIRSDVIDKLSHIHQYVQSEVNATKPCALLFRGAVFHQLSMTFNAVTIIKDEDEVLAKAEFDFANMLDFLQQARREVAKHIPENVA